MVELFQLIRPFSGNQGNPISINKKKNGKENNVRPLFFFGMD